MISRSVRPEAEQNADLVVEDNMISRSVRPEAEQNADLVVEDNMISRSVRPEAEQNADLYSFYQSEIGRFQSVKYFFFGTGCHRVFFTIKKYLFLFYNLNIKVTAISIGRLNT